MKDSKSKKKTAIIIGAGPAGLTAAYELQKQTDIQPIIIEKSAWIGGISRTVNYKGNRMDIGGHRFFSKSDTIMDWWLNIFPIEGRKTQEKENIMLKRNRLSRIYYSGRLFDYPITISKKTILNLGIWKTTKIARSYIKTMILPKRKERNLEDLFINQFGKELYKTFFESYTEKVWGVPCSRINPEWGAQRTKGLSIAKAIAHFLKTMIKIKESDISQKNTQTSLIDKFLYPKYGPGHLWETVADIIRKNNGKIIMHNEAVEFRTKGKRITSIRIKDNKTGKYKIIEGDYFISSMPVKELVAGLDAKVPKEVKTVSDGLVYRDFITVGVLLKKLNIKDNKKSSKLIKDNWIYIQEPGMTMGRIQIFNNWSPYLVKNKNTVWLGLEYFCSEGDRLWSMKDSRLKEFAIDELEKMDFINKKAVIDSTVIRVEKTYPAYFGTYDMFEKIRKYLDTFDNLYLIGRNGMHRYNNTDHSMLTAIETVKNIKTSRKDKSNIWKVNAEKEYHEKK